ncbi:hypothetical protein BT63DRAFT_435535 [Microthyrium microscopicum]|uniref:Glycosyltransferase family 8 protein n=1 Tax=Microthyrium microscopicum TaxID=703497 RepID=A0A6A6UQ54_9PEZI|nr:hypothetical protein BT63DRAFT_435535 [Microthyrium microscopicum]
MGKLLLTSSQVSIAISSFIIVSFTFLLFLAGYILQQQSLEQLHATLRPQQPSPRHNSNPVPTIEYTNSRSRLSRPLGRLQEQIHWHEPKAFDWSKLAHAQLATGPEQLCHALILFHELHRLRSPAPKLLLFPKSWVEERESGQEVPERNGDLDISLRMLKKASRQYGTILVPVSPVEKGANVTEPSSYSLASIFSLTRYDRIMVLPSPSLVLNARPLDSILAYFSLSTLSAYPPLSQASPSMLLIAPSKETYSSLAARKPFHKSDMELLRAEFPNSEPLLVETDPDFKPTLYKTVEQVRAPLAVGERFNATAFSESTAFMQLDDTQLPGAQYDVPYQKIVDLRPKDEDQGFVWEKMYSTYKDRRYRVCGMDLIDWPNDGEKMELK